MDIGIVGLGRMGANMARRLTRGGVGVIAYDHDPSCREVLAGEERTQTAENLATLAAQLERQFAVFEVPPHAIEVGIRESAARSAEVILDAPPEGSYPGSPPASSR